MSDLSLQSAVCRSRIRALRAIVVREELEDSSFVATISIVKSLETAEYENEKSRRSALDGIY